MQSCCLPYCVLLFLTLSFTTVPTLATSVSVKLHQTATLPCKRDCSGLVKWTVFQSRDALAQCNQTSCWSKEGYEMSYNQYLKGYFSLIIHAADYSKRNMYTCECNDRDIDDVRLIIETLLSSVELNLGENLVMDLPIPDPVELSYKPKKSADLYGGQICSVTEHTLQCKAEYTNRTSLSSSNITLRNVQLSDSGSFTIRDRNNNEVIHIYTLFVKEVQVNFDGQQGSQLLKWLLPVLILMVAGCIIGPVCFLKIWRTKHLEHIKQHKLHLEYEKQQQELQLEREKQQQELQLEYEKQQQELQLAREKQEQELQLEREKNLEFQKCLKKFEQWLEENKSLHRSERVQRRAYSDINVAQITDKEHLRFIKEYSPEKTPEYEQRMLTKSRQRTSRRISRRYCSEPPVILIPFPEDEAESINEHVSETELDMSQWGASSNADVDEMTIQKDEMSPLLQSSINLEN